MERARRKRSAEDNERKSNSRAKLVEAELAIKHPRIVHHDKIKKQKETVKGPQRFKSVVKAPENVVTSSNSAIQPVSLPNLPFTINTAPRGRGRPPKLPISMESVTSPGSVILSGTLGESRPKTVCPEIHDFSQVAPFFESDTNPEELDYSTIKLNRRYLTSWVPKLHRKKLIVEGNLIEIKDNTTMVSPNGRWLTTEIEEAPTPCLIRTKKTEYCLEGPISFSNCGKKMPSFIKESFFNGFPPFWRGARDRWISYCEESETNDKLIEMSVVGSAIGNSSSFRRYSDSSLSGVTRSESFLYENITDNFRLGNSDKDASSSVSHAPQSNAKLAQASTRAVEEDDLFKRPVTPRIPQSMKRTGSFKASSACKEITRSFMTTRQSDRSEKRIVLGKDHEAGTTTNAKKRGRPSKSSKSGLPNGKGDGKTEQRMENLDKSNVSPKNISETDLGCASPNTNEEADVQRSSRRVGRNPKAIESEGLSKSGPLAKRKRGRPSKATPLQVNGLSSPSNTKMKNKKAEGITEVNEESGLEIQPNTSGEDLAPAPVEKKKRGRPCSRRMSLEDQRNNKKANEEKWVATLEKKKRGRPSKQIKLLLKKSQPNSEKDNLLKWRQDCVIPSAEEEAPDNLHHVIDAVRDEDTMNPKSKTSDLQELASDAEESDSDSSLPFFESRSKSFFPVPAVSQKGKKTSVQKVTDKLQRKKRTPEVLTEPSRPQKSRSEKAPKSRSKSKMNTKGPQMKPPPKPKNQTSKTPIFNVNPKTIAERRQNAKILQQRGANHQDDFFASNTKQTITHGPQTASDLNNLFPDSDVDFSVRSGSSTKTPINKYFNASGGETLARRSSEKSYTTDSGDNSFTHFAYEHRILKELPKRPTFIPPQIETNELPRPFSNSQEIAIKLLEIDQRQKAAKELEENCMDSDIDVCGYTSSEASIDDRESPVPRGLLDLYKEHTMNEAS